MPDTRHKRSRRAVHNTDHLLAKFLYLALIQCLWFHEFLHHIARSSAFLYEKRHVNTTGLTNRDAVLKQKVQHKGVEECDFRGEDGAVIGARDHCKFAIGWQAIHLTRFLDRHK